MGHSDKEIRIASVGDSAMDLLAMNAIDDSGESRDGLRKYLQTRDPDLVVAKPGMEITWFTIRRIKTSVFASHVAPKATDSSKHVAAFQMGVVKVDSLVSPDGTFHRTYTPQSGDNSMKWIGPDELDSFSPGQLDEIGQVCMQRSELDPKAITGEKYSAFYQAQRSLLGVCLRRTQQEASISRAAAARVKDSSSKNSPGSHPCSPTETPLGSEPPTDVIVTDSATD